MKIAIIGFGNVGSQLAKLWLVAGHSVRAGMRAGSQHEAAARELGAEVLPVAEAVDGADVVALALPWTGVEEALRAVQFAPDQVILDATNPMTATLDVVKPPAGSAAQQIAEWTGHPRVVKAFNTIGAALFGNPAFDGFYCGDDAGAKEVVRGLIQDTSMQPVDVGPLKNAGYLEHMAGLWVDLAVKGRLQGAFGFNLVRPGA